MTSILDKSLVSYIHGLTSGIIYFASSALINQFWPTDFFVNLSNLLIIIVWIIHLFLATLLSFSIIRFIFKKKVIFFNVFSIMISVLLTSLLMTVYVYRAMPLYNAYLAVTLIIYQLFEIFKDSREHK